MTITAGEDQRTSQKALRVNLDSPAYGAFAEIGAGQEVARWFFRVGGAARTVAKSTSAYDMAVSDSLYGPARRYVSRQRLEAMLEREFALLVEGLASTRGATTPFFSFADTVATRRRGRNENGRGWVGIRFQSRPQEAPSQVIVHVQLVDSAVVDEQRTLGVLGVNLIWAALFVRDDLPALIRSLMDGLSRDHIEIDTMKLSGPLFAGVDNRLVSLQLVEQGMTDAAMFTASDEVVQPSEILYNKPILVERGSFRPATNLTIDLLERARERFLDEPEVRGAQAVVLAEITLASLQAGDVGHEDFLARARILHVLGLDVLISRFRPYYQLADYLAGYSDRMIGIAVGMPTIRDLLDEQYYEQFGPGALEAIGRLFKRSVKVYVYPTLDPASGQIISADRGPVPPPGDLVRDFLIAVGSLVPLPTCEPSYLSIRTPDVLRRLQTGDSSWEQMVPPLVARSIKQDHLLGYPG